MRPGNYFFYCVGISLSWVALIISNLFISLGISSEVAHVKEKAAPLLTIDIIFFNNRNIRMSFVFKSCFSN